MLKLKDRNWNKTLAWCVGIAIFGIMFGWVLFPALLKKGIKSQTALKPNSRIRGMWTNIPFPLDFRIYLFNVTNPNDVMKGRKPKLQEVGPYFFQEKKTKINMVEHEEDDMVSFNAVDTFIFDPSKSEGLTGDEIIIMPHIFMVAMAVSVARDKAPMLPMVKQAINIMFHEPQSVFVPIRVMDLLFDGIGLDCSSEEFAAKAVCTALETEPTIDKYNDTTFMFSIFGPKNATPTKTFTVYRGMKNIHDLGRVVKYDGEDEMDLYDDENCNQFRGTEGTIFPPFMTKDQGVWAYAPDMCRSLPATYERPSSYAGIKTSRFTLSFGDHKKDESLHCYCRDPPDGCPPYGIADFSLCLNGAPLLGSMPHFYDADPAVQQKVLGLNPDPEKHKIFLEFELFSGSPLAAAKRMQFNIQMMPIPEIEFMSRMDEYIHPLFWVEESVYLNKTFTNQVKYGLMLVQKINWLIRWTCVLIGLFGGGTAGYMLTKGKPPTVVTPVEEGDETNGKVTGGLTLPPIEKPDGLSNFHKNITVSTIDNQIERY
ncbi:sensory neuron membrane protein 1 isoform X1 [Lutzomyia longipalpis]|uniref:sensory neuron membrane protein 1 isoform X1 n=1 Tax=Lutzomyia longipalpis TaxID=7200 RepID=UPI002483B4F1|nr:sensory neuron membrane protein 1 isoform X1 [Lutzomyia longipalpis]